MCPFKYFLEYHLGIPTRISLAAEIGKFVHKIFEKIARGELDFKNWVDWAAENYKVLEKVPNPKNVNIWHEVLSLVRAVLNRKKEFIPFYRNIKDVEKFFKIEVDNIPIRGIFDLIIEIDPETVEIYDWKSGSFRLRYKELYRDPQILLYNLAVSKLFPKYKFRFATLDYLRYTPISVPLESKYLTIARQLVKRYWWLIKHDDSPRRIEVPNHICKYMCDRELCDIYWEQVHG